MPQLDFPWEQEAARKDRQPVMPDGLSLPHQAAFQAVACLYARYNLKAITRDAASREKKLIKHTLEEREKAETHEKKLLDWHVEVTRKTEQYCNAYRKAETPEEAIEAANKLVEAIDNVAVSHEWEETWNLEKK